MRPARARVRALGGAALGQLGSRRPPGPVRGLPAVAAFAGLGAVAAIVGLGVVAAGGASAQSPPEPSASATQVELRGGVTVGSHTGSAAALDIAPALSFDLTVLRELTPSVSVLAGFHRTAFGCEEGYCRDRDIVVVGNHAVLGAEWRYRAARLRGGVMLGTTRQGSLGESPRIGEGFHLGGGLSVGGGRFRFLPGFSYRWMSARTESASEQAVALSVDLGFGIQVGGGPR